MKRAWKLVDFEEVPRKYKECYIDPRKIDFAVENGIESIPGIQIIENPEEDD